MKKIFLFTLTTALCSLSFAQKLTKEQKAHRANIQQSATQRQTIVSMDTIFSMGKPCGVMFFVGNREASRPEFKVEDLQGNSVLMIKHENVGYSNRAMFRFLLPTETVCYPPRELGNGESIRRLIAEKLVMRDILDPGGVVNADAIQRFVAEYPAPDKISTAVAKDLKEVGAEIKNVGKELGIVGKPKPENSDMVARNRSLPITLGAHEVFQGGVLIGKYETSGFNNGGVVTTQVSISFTNETKCASARFIEGSGIVALFTPKDAKQQDISAQPSKEVEGIVQFLIMNMYL